jgi:hypothetical protein
LAADVDEQAVQTAFEGTGEVRVNLISSKDGTRKAFVEFNTV